MFVVLLSKNKILEIILYWLYFFLFLFLYKYGISNHWEYAGFVDLFDFSNLIVSVVILFFLTPFVVRNELPSDFFVNFVLYIMIIPSLVFYTGAGVSHRFAFITSSAFLCFAIVRKICFFKIIKIINFKPKKLLIIFGLLAFLVLVANFAINGTRFLNFNLSSVYDLRREAAESLPGIFAYLNSITTKIILPFAIVYSLHYRKYLAVFLFFSCSIFFFAITAHKSPLFYPFVVLFFYSILKTKITNLLFLSGLIFVVVFSLVDMWLIAIEIDNPLSIWFTSLFARRGLLVPSFLNWSYIEYFTDTSKYLWANSRITFNLIETSHVLNAAQLVGDDYLGSGAHANTGWIGSGYAQAGYFGVIVYSIFIGFVLKIIDVFGKKHGKPIVVSIFVLPMFTIFTSSDFLTGLLSHGLLFAILMFFLIKPERHFAMEEHR